MGINMVYLFVYNSRTQVGKAQVGNPGEGKICFHEPPDRFGLSAVNEVSLQETSKCRIDDLLTGRAYMLVCESLE
jgi:hypothetical protein